MYTCFIYFEKAYDRVPIDKLWAVPLEYNVRGQLVAAIKSLYKQSQVCVCVNGMKIKPFNVCVELRQGYVLSPLLFIIYMNKIDKDSSSSSAVTFRQCNVRRLLFAYALDRFSNVCLDAGMKISTAKTEIMCLSRYPVQCSFQTNGVTLKQTENLEITFSSDDRQDNELDTRIGKASTVMRQLYRPVVLIKSCV